MKKLILIIIIIINLFVNYTIIGKERITINNIRMLENCELINLDNKLEKNYIPKDIIKIDNLYVNKNLYCNYLKMINNIKNNENIKIVSAYRDYNYQNNLYLKEHNGNIVSVMPPGSSEHQLGLAIDISINKLNYKLDDKIDTSDTYKWLLNNSYKYGFIIRYNKNKEKYTKVIYEPWHLRYIDPIIADILYKKNWSLEELYNFLSNEKLKYSYNNKMYLIWKENNNLYCHNINLK